MPYFEVEVDRLVSVWESGYVEVEDAANLEAATAIVRKELEAGTAKIVDVQYDDIKDVLETWTVA